MSVMQRDGIERYELGELLGSGAMGTVFAARHHLTGQAVALKIIPGHLAKHELSEARFRREVRVSARVDHPGITRVFDAGVDPKDGAFFIAMERLHGATLRARVESDPELGLGVALGWLLEVLDALAAAHAVGVVHRDLKPDNVFLQRLEDGGERVKLLDFGVARDVHDASATRAESGVGTPHFMPPEQARDARSVGPAADIWAAGAMLYWLLSGRLPFEGEGAYDVVVRAMVEPHPPLPESAPSTLIELVDLCLAKNPSDRPVDAADLAARLQAALDDAETAEAVAALRVGGRAFGVSEAAITTLAGSSGLSSRGPRGHSQPATAEGRIGGAESDASLRATGRAPTPAPMRTGGLDWTASSVGARASGRGRVAVAAGLALLCGLLVAFALRPDAGPDVEALGPRALAAPEPIGASQGAADADPGRAPGDERGPEAAAEPEKTNPKGRVMPAAPAADLTPPTEPSPRASTAATPRRRSPSRDRVRSTEPRPAPAADIAGTELSGVRGGRIEAPVAAPRAEVAAAVEAPPAARPEPAAPTTSEGAAPTADAGAVSPPPRVNPASPPGPSRSAPVRPSPAPRPAPAPPPEDPPFVTF
jgi:hypothetical protein